jgi:hypothetical protein
MRKKHKRLFAWAFILSVGLSTLLAVFTPALTDNAYAASYNFVDKTTIRSSDGEIFQDRNIWDDIQGYAYQHDSCTDSFEINGGDFRRGSSDGTDALVATLHRERYDSGSNSCEDDGSEQITITNRGVRYVKAYVIDDQTMFMPQSKGEGLFSGSDDGVYNNTVLRTTDTAGQKEYIPEGSDGFSNGGVRILYDGDPPNEGQYQNQECSVTCQKGIDETITISTSAPNPSIYPGAPTAGSAGSSSNPQEADESCESAGDFAWALCPVAFALSGAIEWTTTQISRLLEADRDSYTHPDLYRAWSNIRNIALSLLIVLMLIMVIATALNMQTFDAYTVKRAFPRMVAAIIFISLSWYICIFLIDIFNLMGSGVVGIMTGPFKEGGIELTDIFGPGIGSFLVQWIGGIGLAIGIILIIVFFWSTILIGIGTAFFVLLLRQLFILVLMLLAPLAILAWIFPGNDKLWKTWWGSFSKLLMMYPLIMALLAAGRIFAYLTQNANQGGAAQGFALDPLIAIIAFTIPFAFIPFTFKFAGGLFATVSGMANDRSKGLFDRAKKSRQDKAHRWAQGNAFKGAASDTMRGRFNKGVQMAANAKHYGGVSSLRHPSRIGSSIRSAVGEQEFEHAMEASEKVPGGKAFFASDDLMLAGLEGNGDRTATMNYLRGLTTTDSNGRRVAKYSGAALDNMTNQVMRMRQQMGNDAFNIASLAKAPSTGTAFVGEEAGRWHQLIAQNTHGDGSLAASIVAAGKSGFRSAQRYEVSEAGFGDHMQAIQMAGDENTEADEISRFIADKAYAGGGAAAVVGARNSDSARMFAGAMMRDIDRGREQTLQTGDSTHVTRALSAASAVQDQIGSAKRLVSDVISNEVFAAGSGIGSDTTGQQLTVVQAFDQAKRDNPDVWIQAKKEYLSEMASAAGGAPPGTPGAPPTPPPPGAPLPS